MPPVTLTVKASTGEGTKVSIDTSPPVAADSSGEAVFEVMSETPYTIVASAVRETRVGAALLSCKYMAEVFYTTTAHAFQLIEVTLARVECA